jgi:hypothetical protein
MLGLSGKQMLIIGVGIVLLWLLATKTAFGTG